MSEILLVAGCYMIVSDVLDREECCSVLCKDIRGAEITIGKYSERQDAFDRVALEKKPDRKGGVYKEVTENLFDLPIHYMRAGG